jgi:AcrR family transcriptional regulator
MTRPLEGKPVQARALRTRMRILEAGVNLFATKGFPETSMDDIAQAAGMSKGGLYHHFGTKGAVLGAIVRGLGEAGAQPLAREEASENGLGKLLVDAWAEAARSPELRAAITVPHAFNEIIAAGRVIASQTREPSRPDSEEAAA